MKLLAQSLSNAFGVRTGYTDADGNHQTTTPRTTAFKLSRKARAAIAKYGESVCRDAYRRHIVDGEGASTLAAESGSMTTRQMDAAIDAGRELSVERW